MTKREVLEIFVQNACFVTPDAICRQLGDFHHRSSVYSYLFRLHKQGLLLRGEVSGRVAYRISRRGFERLNFLQSVYKPVKVGYAADFKSILKENKRP